MRKNTKLQTRSIEKMLRVCYSIGVRFLSKCWYGIRMLKRKTCKNWIVTYAKLPCDVRYIFLCAEPTNLPREPDVAPFKNQPPSSGLLRLAVRHPPAHAGSIPWGWTALWGNLFLYEVCKNWFVKQKEQTAPEQTLANCNAWTWKGSFLYMTAAFWYN